MTDRELLELAAKAADITLSHWDKKRNTFAPVIGVSGEWWNPLTDDGDALRLAVKLEIAINPWAGKTVCWHEDTKTINHEGHYEDPCESTRRAIVRAAAEIGRTL